MPRSRRWRVNALWPTGGRDDEPDTLDLLGSPLWHGARCARVEVLARQHLSLSQGDVAEYERPSSWPRRRMLGRGTGRAYPSAHSRLPPPRRGLPQVMARLRFAGVRTSPRRVRRAMRENGLLAPHRVGRTETKPHNGTIITDKVNEMWGTDMTQTITIREGRANVFVDLSSTSAI